MKKEDALREIVSLARSNNISPEELMQALEPAKVEEKGGFSLEKSQGANDAWLRAEDMIRFLGGGIVVLGIGFFLAQNWDKLHTATKILSTLGSGIAAFFSGIFLAKKEDWHGLSSAFHLIAGIAIPIGFFVMLNEAGIDATAAGAQSVVWAVLFLSYLTVYRLFSGNLFVLFFLVFGTAFFASITNRMAIDTALALEGDFGAYQALVIGLTYILLGHGFESTERKPLTKYLYPIGLLVFFFAALDLGGYAPDQNYFWEIVFPGLSLAAVFLSLPLRSRAFLLIGSASLVAYIFKITGEYFADSFGWPLALILAGFGMMAVGSLFLKLNRQYEKQ